MRSSSTFSAVMRIAIVLCSVLCCSACQSSQTASLQQFAAADLIGAAAVATAGQDASGKACWAYMGAVVAAIPPALGTATAIELKQVIRQPAFLAACAGTLPIAVANP